MASDPTPDVKRILALTHGTRIQRIAQLAEHYSFAAAALPANDETLCHLGLAFIEIKDLARAEEAA